MSMDFLFSESEGETLDQDSSQLSTMSSQLPSLTTLIHQGITFPCNKNKKPTVKGWNKLYQTVPHMPGSFYAILCGARTNIIVVDCDVLKDDNPEKFVCGVRSWHTWLKKYGNPKAPTVETPSGGLHVYFRFTEKVNSAIPKIDGSAVAPEYAGKIVKIDILSTNKSVAGVGSPGYNYIDCKQHLIPVPEVPYWLIDIVESGGLKPVPSKVMTGPTPKRIKMDDSIKQIGNKYLSKISLMELVMNLEQRHSDKYDLWRNVLWALNKYGHECGYKTLEVANSFSKRSSKYKNFEDVKRTYDCSNGTLTLSYLIGISKIYEEGCQNMAKYLDTILPSMYLPLTVMRIDIRDRNKFRITICSANESHVLFIIPHLCVITDEDGKILNFLEKEISSNSTELVSLCPTMGSGFIVSLSRERFVFREKNESAALVTLYQPLKAAEAFIILPNGKQSSREFHLLKLKKALRAETVRLLSLKSGKKFSDDEDDNNIVEVKRDPDTTRSDSELVEALLTADPRIMSRYCYLGHKIYHCNTETNVWYMLTEKSLDWHILEDFKTTVNLTEAERRYIGMRNGIVKIRDGILGKIEDLNFADRLDSMLQLFVTTNKTIDMSFVPPVIRNIRSEDLVETTCGWTYNAELASKYEESVKLYFAQLLPRPNEREWFLSFVAKMLNGHRTEKLFVILTDKRRGNNGKTTLTSLLHAVFGNYYLGNSKIIVGSGSQDKNQHDGGTHGLKGKRLLVADELKKFNTLDCGFIKAITGGSNYHLSGRKMYSQTQFKFPVQAGLIMVFNENDMPTYDTSDQAFLNRIVVCPMRSRFVSKQEMAAMERNGEDRTDTFIADSSLSHKFQEWRSATLDLLMTYYTQTLPPIPNSMVDWKEILCDNNDDYGNWLDSHVYEDCESNGFITAQQIMLRMRKPGESCKPADIKMLKSVMATWAAKNKFIYKPRHVFKRSNGRRAEAKSVILNAAIDGNIDF